MTLVYHLYRPGETSPFYVGITDCAWNRREAHEERFGRIVFEVVHRCSTRKEARRVEREEVKKWMECGPGLANIQYSSFHERLKWHRRHAEWQRQQPVPVKRASVDWASVDPCPCPPPAGSRAPRLSTDARRSLILTELRELLECPRNQRLIEEMVGQPSGV